MADVNITSLPVATSIGATTDYLELSKYTGAPGALYQSVRVTPQLIANQFAANISSSIEIVISNAGYALATGVQPYITVPYAATITGASMVAAPSGSLVVDIWRCTYGQFDGGSTHPVVGDSICDSNKLTISGGTKTQNSLANWTTSLNQGDVLALNISSASTVTQATVTLILARSAV
jgi:hypothetical protein